MKFRTWRQISKNFYRIILAPVIAQKILKNGKILLEKYECISKMVKLGGWSSYYCKKTWNNSTSKNEADLKIFELLLEIDIQNGADTSKIAENLRYDGAFEAVKVTKD